METTESLTLGERLDRHGRRLMGRLVPTPPWAAPLRAAIARSIALTAPFVGRFERVEWTPAAGPPRRGAGSGRQRSGWEPPPPLRIPEPAAWTGEVSPRRELPTRSAVPVTARPDEHWTGADRPVRDRTGAGTPERSRREDAVPVGRSDDQVGRAQPAPISRCVDAPVRPRPVPSDASPPSVPARGPDAGPLPGGRPADLPAEAYRSVGARADRPGERPGRRVDRPDAPLAGPASVPPMTDAPMPVEETTTAEPPAADPAVRAHPGWSVDPARLRARRVMDPAPPVVGQALARPVAGRAGPAVARDAGPAVRATPGRPLAEDVRSRLRDIVGPQVNALRVHDDGPADALVRTYRSDAVTVGRDVYFRQGKFRPREERGFALLAHEATHVAALLRPGAAWHRATGQGVRDEEDAALARERATLPGERAGVPDSPPADRQPQHGLVNPGLIPAGPPAGPSPPAAAAPAAVAAHPMPAPVERVVDPVAPPRLNLEALRRGLLDDLRRQLRSEFERGG